MHDWVLRGCRLPGRDGTWDVALSADTIAAVGERVEGRGERELAVDGRLLLPGLVNGHLAVAGGDDLEGHASMMLETAVRHGTTALRLTVDLDPVEPLMPLRVLARLRAQHAGRITARVALRVSLAAMAQDSRVAAHVERAERAGADALVVEVDRDTSSGPGPAASLTRLAAIGLPLDIVADSTLPPGRIAPADLSLTRVLDAMPGEVLRKVRLLEPNALAAVHRDDLAPLLRRLAETGVTVVICPFDALRRAGRGDVSAARRGIPRIKELLAAGIRIALGSGASHDHEVSLDPLVLVWLAAYGTHLGTPPALERLRSSVTTAAGEVSEGARADLVVLEAPTFADAVVDHADRAYVFAKGRLVHAASRRTETTALTLTDAATSTLVIRQAALTGRAGRHDVVVLDGIIQAIGPAAGPAGGTTIEADGRLLVPAFVDAHLHVDKTFVMDRVAFPAGILTVGEAVAAMGRVKAAYTADDLVRRGRLTFTRALRHGTTAIRAQCDVDPLIGLLALEALLTLRREFAPLLDVQIVAFPQEGLLRDPRTIDLMRTALRAGADVVGGGPLDDDYRAHIEGGFALARELGCPVDIHADLAIDGLRPPSEWEAPLIAARARDAGLGGRVAVGHLAATSTLTAEQTRTLAATLAESGVHVAALSASEMYRQGMNDPVNARRGMPRVRDLLEGGVNVVFASNNVRDAFVTFGDADMLEQALLGALAAHLDDLGIALDMVTSRPATLMGLTHRNAVEVGKQADLVLLDARSAAEAVSAQAEKLYVIRRGHIVVRNERQEGADRDAPQGI